MLFCGKDSALAQKSFYQTLRICKEAPDQLPVDHKRIRDGNCDADTLHDQHAGVVAYAYRGANACRHKHINDLQLGVDILFQIDITPDRVYAVSDNRGDGGGVQSQPIDQRKADDHVEHRSDDRCLGELLGLFQAHIHNAVQSLNDIEYGRQHINGNDRQSVAIRRVRNDNAENQGHNRDDQDRRARKQVENRIDNSRKKYVPVLVVDMQRGGFRPRQIEYRKGGGVYRREFVADRKQTVACHAHKHRDDRSVGRSHHPPSEIVRDQGYAVAKAFKELLLRARLEIKAAVDPQREHNKHTAADISDHIGGQHTRYA